METRNEVRNELGIKNEFVIGHVGRFSYQKNHEFLISLFERFTENNHNSKLLLIGVGEKEEHIKELVNKKNLADKVMFLGNRNDVNKLYQAMDAFVLPSFFEGIPVVGIEAQFSGLNCIFSDKIPEEVCFASKCHFVSLNNTVDWLNILDEVKGEIRSGCDIKNSKYEIRYSKEILQTLYINLSNNFIGAEDRK
jgi:glycosyltransferase involved in cell wall biosynthesis